MATVRLVLVSVLVALSAIAGPGYAQETPHYDVVAEYIRQLGGTKANQDIVTKELAEKGTQRDKMATAIRNSTRVKLALSEYISRLQGMKLNPPFETLLPTTVEFYRQRMEFHEHLITIATAFSTSTPKPDVDYDNLAATMPQITATLEYIDKSLFQQTPIWFLLLVDQKPDAQGHVSRLMITKKQARQLVSSIDSYFGASLNAKNPSWAVSSADLLKTGLTKKGYRYADDK